MSDASSSVPAWLQLFLATLIGGVIAAGTLVKIAFGFNSRLQRIENQDLDQIITEHLEKERHDKLYPMMTDRVYRPMDKLEDQMTAMGKDIATLLERDRTGQRLEKIISALNRQAMKPDED